MSAKLKRPWLQLAIRAMDHRKTLQQQTLHDSLSAAKVAEASLAARRSELTEVEQAWRWHLRDATIDPVLDEGYRRYGLRATILETQEKKQVEDLDKAVATEVESLRLLVGQSSAMQSIERRLHTGDVQDHARAAVRAIDELWSVRHQAQGSHK